MATFLAMLNKLQVNIKHYSAKPSARKYYQSNIKFSQSVAIDPAAGQPLPML